MQDINPGFFTVRADRVTSMLSQHGANTGGRVSLVHAVPTSYCTKGENDGTHVEQVHASLGAIRFWGNLGVKLSPVCVSKQFTPKDGGMKERHKHDAAGKKSLISIARKGHNCFVFKAREQT